MIDLTNKRTKLEDLLARMAESIQLDSTRRRKMEETYHAIENVLDSDEHFFGNNEFEIYPQGSVSLGTTVRPIGKNEFDLDIVVHIQADYQYFTPLQIYNQLKRVLQNSGNHKDLVELKNRCIRLNYAGDFHMDILPGIQENDYDVNRLVVPDRELGDWTSSNPRGFSEWFLSKNNAVLQTLLEKAYAQAELPPDDFAKKKPLQRSVQLVKMYRDQYFENNQSKSTSSIILTTIFAEYYQGEDSIYSTIENIINKIKIDISSKELTNERIVVLNPVNSQEDFSEKWDINKEPELYLEFKRFVNHLDTEWQKLKDENGHYESDTIIKGLFGEALYERGISRQKEYLETKQVKDRANYTGLKKLAAPLTPQHKPWLNNEF
ncbi:MAG: nucleotidyltransferase [Candidatus Aenigmarchaeota archaeon]|nr:nucleotidyltransferase [Candidatus Aenigmarchaeota archaeon]